MLVLSRRIGEELVIDGEIRIVVLGVRGNQIRLGIEAPPSVHIVRHELVERDRDSRQGHSRPERRPAPVLRHRHARAFVGAAHSEDL